MDTKAISDSDLLAARTAWGEALISIAKEYEAKGLAEAQALASHVLDTAYGYNLGPVLFKPTLSGGAQTFRATKKGALSYFVGNDPDYPHDNGFALKGWHEVTSETAASFKEGSVAMWMGWISMTDRDGQVTKVDKSFGYKMDSEGCLRIVLHHSSLPYYV